MMINYLRVAAALALGALGLATTAVQAGDAPPPWAYGFTTPVAPGTPPTEPNPGASNTYNGSK